MRSIAKERMRVYTVTAPDMEFNTIFGTAHIE